MKRIVVAMFVAGLSWNSEAAEMPLKRVVLSTSGLAQFTYSGEFAPGSTLDLSVRLDQVDDILKSLTIFDREGAIGAVSLPGKAPLTELFRDLPFGPDALNSPADLLNALVGSEVEIVGQVNARGRVFHVEEETVQLPNNGGQATHHRLTLLTDRGLVQAVLEDVSALRFVDGPAKEQIDRALAGLAQNRAKDRRSLAIDLLGQTTREVGFSYVVAAPVWKTAYRLVLPKEGDRARLQGWGVVENLTGSDWKDIELSLVSGNPVAFKQSLYTAFFVDRPEIPVTASSRVVPRRDEAEEPVPAPQSVAAGAPRDRAASVAAMGNLLRGNVSPLSALPLGPAKMPPEEIGRAAVAAEAEEASTQVLYRFPIKISLAAGSTMMVPFVDRDIAASRTWLYQPETNARRPLAAVRLRNDGESALPAGLITAFERGGDGEANFAGDAQLPITPKGGLKFVTFAIDAKTEIRRNDRGIRRTRFGRAVNGELTLTVRSRRTIDYEITPPADEDREIIIDEAHSDGWRPAGDAKDLEETAARLRYKVAAAKGGTTKASLTLERLEHETVNLGTLAPERLLATISGLENEDAALKDAVARLGALVAEINGTNARRRELEAETKKIGDDQERIRRNLQAVGQGSDLGRRYLDALRVQEDRLAAIATTDKTLETDLAAKRTAAQELAKSLTL
ncbi:MAG: hypothetical protein ACLPKB_14590 [Xanthobacteraceae bacterium]